MKYGTNASHEQRVKLDREINARHAGWNAAWNGQRCPHRRGTPEYQAWHHGVDAAAFDAKRIWA